MCLIKCGDLDKISIEENLAKTNAEMNLYVEKQQVIGGYSEKIKKLISANFIGVKRYEYLKFKEKMTDEEIISHLEEEVKKLNLGKEFYKIIKSGKGKVGNLLED